ncbi:MAG: hypothetical protein AAFX09_13750 [Pseudomonadota bacterium]
MLNHRRSDVDAIDFQASFGQVMRIWITGAATEIEHQAARLDQVYKARQPAGFDERALTPALIENAGMTFIEAADEFSVPSL